MFIGMRAGGAECGELAIANEDGGDHPRLHEPALARGLRFRSHSADREGISLQALRRYKEGHACSRWGSSGPVGSRDVVVPGPVGPLHSTRGAETSSCLARFYPGTLGRVYKSEKAWRDVFVPILGVAFLAVGLIWLWKGMGT
jgi:hypothetical protein